MTSERRKEIEKIAFSVYNKCLKNKYGISNIFDSIKNLDKNINLIRYSTDSTKLGFIKKRVEDDVYIVFTNTNCILSREIFTLAHEIGHCYLNHLDNNNYFFDVINEKNNEIEIEANYFAACLLMPKKIVHKYLFDFNIDKVSKFSIANIMLEFNCSFETVVNRLNSLGYISTASRTLFIENKTDIHIEALIKKIDSTSRLCEKSTNKRTLPTEYLKWVISNYNNGLISRTKLDIALEYFGINYSDIEDQIHIKEDTEIDLGEYFNEKA